MTLLQTIRRAFATELDRVPLQALRVFNDRAGELDQRTIGTSRGPKPRGALKRHKWRRKKGLAASLMVRTAWRGHRQRGHGGDVVLHGLARNRDAGSQRDQ
jgi:hypothetical protein